VARFTTRRQADQAVLDTSNTLDAVTFIVPNKIDNSGAHSNIANSGGTANSGGKRSSPPTSTTSSSSNSVEASQQLPSRRVTPLAQQMSFNTILPQLSCRMYQSAENMLCKAATAATVTSKLQHQAHCHLPVYLWGRSISGSSIFKSVAAGRWAHMGVYADKLARHHRPQSSKRSCMHTLNVSIHPFLFLRQVH